MGVDLPKYHEFIQSDLEYLNQVSLHWNNIARLVSQFHIRTRSTFLDFFNEAHLVDR